MMNKKIAALCVCLLLAAFVSAQAAKPKTEKFPVEGHSTAFILMSEVYKTDNWLEAYLTYEEDSNLYNENDAEKALSEFISNYKRDHVYSTVEIDDLKGTTVGKKTTSMQKRVTFRNVNRR